MPDSETVRAPGLCLQCPLAFAGQGRGANHLQLQISVFTLLRRSAVTAFCISVNAVGPERPRTTRTELLVTSAASRPSAMRRNARGPCQGEDLSSATSGSGS